ncbi:PKD domain-containing protein [Tautonia plasticadhaerens]|nr:PKD domain-containing protein [Tautonia plasticadhaerens]
MDPASAGAIVIRDQPGWPVVFEMGLGDTYNLWWPSGDGPVERTVRLVSVAEHWETDLWIEDNDRRETLRMAEVVVEVDGVRATLLARPHQMPVVVNGLRLYVEATRTWATEARIEPLAWRGGDVRLSAVAEGEPWGPEDLRFPIGEYRWRSASYNNTWLSLVPYNLLYYHRGEELGAIPGRLPVVALTGGTVVVAPPPGGDGDSNYLAIEAPSGMRVLYAHMDIETIDPALVVGTEVEAGRVLGRTGMTRDGRKSQVRDHHLHVELQYGRTNLSTYPFLVEAYLRDYDDPSLAVAGGYHFGLPGQTIRLDGSRSLARQGREIAEHTWRLHDGREVHGPVAEVRYDRPGLYSETLVVRTADGAEDRDHAQVRIYDPGRGRRMAFGWFYHAPVRGIRPGDEVTFENRLVRAGEDVRIDFGDGSEPEAIRDLARHAYRGPGRYEAVLRGTGPGEEPVEVRMEVVVEGP